MYSFDRGKVERFATLPPGEAYPEGIDEEVIKVNNTALAHPELP